MNGRDLVIPVDPAEALVVAVAAGDPDVPELATVLGRQLIDTVARPPGS